MSIEAKSGLFAIAIILFFYSIITIVESDTTTNNNNEHKFPIETSETSTKHEIK